MKIGNTNLDIDLNTCINTSTSKIYLLKENNSRPIKKDEINLKRTINLIPSSTINLTTTYVKNKNETVIDVVKEIKTQFDDVPLDKKINLAQGILSITPIRGNFTDITTNYMMISERKKKIEKSIEENDTKEALAQTALTAKNTWAVINNSVKLANYLAEESYSLGKISKSKLYNFEKGTSTISNINSMLVLPFSIIDVAYNYDSMKSYKKNIDSNKSKLTDKEIKTMNDTYNVKKVTFGLSTLSLGAITFGLIFKSSNAATIAFVSDVGQKFSKFFEDEKARQSVKNSYNILKARI